MRIWHQASGDLKRAPIYRDALQRHAAAVCESGTQVELFGLDRKDYISGVNNRAEGDVPRLTTSDVLGSAYLYHLSYSKVIENARRAEREGYDAFIVGSFSEPFLTEIRSAVSIPVASIGEANYLLACSYGKFQAHISNVPTVARLAANSVERYKLSGRVSGSYSLGRDVDEIFMQASWQDPQPIIDRFVKLGFQAIEEGADVIIPTEGVLSELLFANNIMRIGDVPVFDTMGVVWKYAEFLVNLKGKLKLSVGRAWEYSIPNDAAVAVVRQAQGLDD